MEEPDIRIVFDERLEAAIADVGNYPIINGIDVAQENTPNLTADKWLRTELLVLSSENGTIGAANQSDPYIKHEGRFIISIFTKLNFGTKVNGDIVRELITLFRNITFDGVWAQAPYPQKIGDDKHGYYAVNLKIPFTTVS